MLRRVLLLLVCLLSLNLARAQAPASAAPAAPEPVAVYLIPTENFPLLLAGNMAAMLGRDTGLTVRASAALPLDGMAPLPNSGQYAAEDFVEKVMPLAKTLSGVTAQTFFVVLTTRDLNTRSRNSLYYFSSRASDTNMSVVSMARLLNYQEGLLMLDVTAATRVYKMCKRAIGEAQLGWVRNDDPDDLMFGQVSSIAALDRIGLEHKGGKRTAVPAAPEQLSVATVDGMLHLSIPASALTLAVPRQDWTVRERQSGDAARGFYLSAQNGALLMVGNFENAYGSHGVGRAWDNIEADIRARGEPEPSEVSIENIGGWKTLLFDQRSANSSSMVAYYVRDGTWISLRLMLTKNGKPEARREALRQQLKALKVSAKSAVGKAQ
ncbi:hypothetical protein [Pseudoduganella violacea]|uniref:Uncharacterized protein n=1 Tax=Pseudoduganella violacea TaxID=1715466 RepID=A0A7W5FTJ1_9BURK|nr:hypothetical protein [Pseudoduganella violacea]MBB3118702.1 hypothetical protein [Pseudoduganella violacea]